MPPLRGTLAAPRAREGSYEDLDGCAYETRLQDQECLMTRGDPNSVDDMTTKNGRDESPTNDDDQALASVKDTGTKSGEQQRLTPVPTKIAEGTEEDATIPSSLTDAKAYTRPPGLKVTVRSQKTATSQATTTATTPGIQIFKNRRSKRLRPPATSGSSSTTPGVPANLATTPGYETGPSPGVTPVFTEAQIEAIMRGDLTGIPEARHVDIEERLYPVSPADLERQVHRALQFHLTDDQASFALPLRDLELTRLPSAIWRIRRRTLSSRHHYLDLALGCHHIESALATPDGRPQTPELSPRVSLTQTIPSRSFPSTSKPPN
ncbi:hypothetical protein DYB28_000633 [Aphanomyces astaci]|uniref:Uncharacterized protein n=1 Tax=Aphanomyces astaci TaxID=112090 RepID=A0A9X8E181_APHAT|nr:hypothetical protein DYB28_000633 [Aphanomyces astaci]